MPIINSIYFLFFCSIFMGSAIRIGPVYPFRILLPLAFGVSCYLYFTKKQRRKQSTMLDLAWIYTLFLMVFSLASSVIGYLVLGYLPSINDCLNFCAVGLLLTTILFFLQSDPLRFNKLFYQSLLVMYIVYFGVALIEIFTGFHFPDSVAHIVGWNVPTGFYVNPNDFATIFTLLLLLLLTKFNSKYFWIQFFVIAFHLGIVFYAGSRISVFVILLFLFLFRFKRVVKLSFIILMIGSLFYNTIEKKINIPHVNLSSILIFSNDKSGNIRSELYKEALCSVLENGGMGFGINAAQTYYESKINRRLGGIVNPHSWILELLINSGVIVLCLFIILNIYVFYILVRRGKVEHSAHLIFYTLLLFASSSSLFLWPIHLLFLVYVGWAESIIKRLPDA